jgi:type IX secretion system substrate protein
MKTYIYPQSAKLFLHRSMFRIMLSLSVMIFSLAVSAQELRFRDPELSSGIDKQDGAVYRFRNVITSGGPNVDALVKITARSSSQVKLLDIDKKTTGHDKAFQPQITYGDNNSPAGISDWWMEFEFTFVSSSNGAGAKVDSFRLTAIDIDGNGDKINEWVSFYNEKAYTLESNTVLQALNVLDILGVLVGKKFSGPTTNFVDIDTSATAVMVTNLYQNTNTFKIRAGAHSTGANGAADRMYSFYFKSFDYQAPATFHLPLVLNQFNATLSGKKVNLNWVTGMEKELSHFVIERSANGVDYVEAGKVSAKGSSNVKIDYSYQDALNSSAKGMLYYRLKMVDIDNKYQYSPVRVIRVAALNDEVKILAYPNPVTTELRVTLPQDWQNTKLSFTLYNVNGQAVKQVVNNRSGQTETINVADVPVGLYMMKVVNGDQAAVQRIVKGK